MKLAYIASGLLIAGAGIWAASTGILDRVNPFNNARERFEDRIKKMQSYCENGGEYFIAYSLSREKTGEKKGTVDISRHGNNWRFDFLPEDMLPEGARSGPLSRFPQRYASVGGKIYMRHHLPPATPSNLLWSEQSEYSIPFRCPEDTMTTRHRISKLISAKPEGTRTIAGHECEVIAVISDIPGDTTPVRYCFSTDSDFISMPFLIDKDGTDRWMATRISGRSEPTDIGR
ncbi:MAG: hypothetical protein HYW25_00720 [Candidatus Aenigmarchaeota archaeon]|nr:hypothetical protein [Candidatus Aenigmarchaeota archaeon]